MASEWDRNIGSYITLIFFLWNNLDYVSNIIGYLQVVRIYSFMKEIKTENYFCEWAFWINIIIIIITTKVYTYGK